MSKKGLRFLTISALTLLVSGIVFSFLNLEVIKIKVENSGYVGAIFSLSGVLLYFGALMYQIKEYKLQVVELRKSVQAQTKSSEALDEQKRILLEQNANSLIFGMINSFNSFKERNSTQEIIDTLFEFYQSIFARRWQNKLNGKELNFHDLNIQYAREISDIFCETITKQEVYLDFKKYVQFAYNILYLIDENKSKSEGTDLKPFFFSQLNTKETILLYLSNLVETGMPYYDNLKWDYYVTQEIIKIIEKAKDVYTDYEKIDCELLTQEFNKLKQGK